MNLSLSTLDREVLRHLNFTLGHHQAELDKTYVYRALAIAVRDRLINDWVDTRKKFEATDDRKVYYLSLEFLIGRSLSNAVLNLGIDDEAASVAKAYGVKLEELAEEELDAGLGNGGLGRLAACFLESCAKLKLSLIHI